MAYNAPDSAHSRQANPEHPDPRKGGKPLTVDPDASQAPFRVGDLVVWTGAPNAYGVLRVIPESEYPPSVPMARSDAVLVTDKGWDSTHNFRRATPEELARYQLDQLGQGL